MGKTASRKRGAKFVATIYRIWMLRYVDVPEAAVRTLMKQADGHAKSGKAGAKRPEYIPVVAMVNAGSARTTLVPAGGGRYRMQFNATLRKAAGVDVGEAVGVEILWDHETREIATPADLLAVLKDRPKAKKAFHEAPPGYRRQMLKWMDGAKSTAVRQRRIEILIDRLLERAILGPKRRSKS